MLAWNAKSSYPLAISLAADARLGPTSYSDDQIWELTLGSGDPPALALRSTYGLRARAIRLFPRFIEGDTALTDPALFARAPGIDRFYPNFLALGFAPFTDIDVEAEYWVPQSQGVCGRLKVTNSGRNARRLRLEWVAQLTPTSGQRMAPLEMLAAPVLTGQTGGLAPVVFLTGGPQAGSGSYPALALDLDLAPGEARLLTWAHAALPSPEESFTLARSLAARKWEAERARIELINASQVEIYTGAPEWDAAFALAQKLAFSLFVGPTDRLPAPSFVFTRQPDQGFSLRGDGSDYNHLWNGQPPLDAYYLAGLILPGGLNLAQGLLRNFLVTQTEDGFIDWKPGLGGQRSRLPATPLLASLAWRIYETNPDRAFLEEVFPALLKFVHAWFSPPRDRDGDGIPEWDHPMQAGVEDHPVYSRWHSWAQGVEISSAESPALCAFLYHECQTLLRMAAVLGRREPVSALEALVDHLRVAVETSWDPEDNCYHEWDRDTHFSTRGEWLGEREGPGTILIQRKFSQPVRLLVRVETSGESTRRPQMTVRGASASGNARVEQVSDERFKWYMGRGSLTGERVYTALDEVELQGLDPADRVSLYSVDYHMLDHTLLLPLWAGIPAPERARSLVENTIFNPEQFWQPFGLPACPGAAGGEELSVCQTVHLPWNSLVGEGLVNYGFRSEAALLVTRLMTGICQTLKREGAFRRYYQAQNPQGVGERNALNGLAPVGLFLEVLGVRLLSPRRVALAGFNPFPWPVTVKYRGMTILRQKEKSMVIFPDGQTVVVSDPEPRVVSLEMDQSGG